MHTKLAMISFVFIFKVMLLTENAAAVSNPPHNRLPGLIPKSGGWRGSTLGSASLAHDGPKQYKQIQGPQLHLWGVSKTPNNTAITATEKEFVENAVVACTTCSRDRERKTEEGLDFVSWLIEEMNERLDGKWKLIGERGRMKYGNMCTRMIRKLQ